MDYLNPLCNKLWWSKKSLKNPYLLVYASHGITYRVYMQLVPLWLVYIEKCAQKENICSFPLWVTNKLIIILPYAWKCSKSTLEFLLKGYILSLLDALEEDNSWEEGNYSGFVTHSYMLESASLCHFEHTLLLFPSLPLFCKLAIEMEDWSGGGPGGGLGLLISTRCRQSLSPVSLYLINRNIHFSSIVCVWLWLFFIHGCNYFNLYMLVLYMLE